MNSQVKFLTQGTYYTVVSTVLCVEGRTVIKQEMECWSWQGGLELGVVYEKYLGYVITARQETERVLWRGNSELWVWGLT